MQEIQPGDHEGTTRTNTDTAQGILEDTNGVARLYSEGELVATGYDYKKLYISGVYPEGDNEHHIEWNCWRFEEIRWSHKAALLFLQGSSMQQLVVPYLLLQAHPLPPFDPRPGALSVVMAELQVAPDPPLDHHMMFSLLAPDAIRLPLSGA